MGAWVQRARRSVHELLASWQPGPRSVVLVAGESGAGKSTLAGVLAGALREAGRSVRVLSMDDYFVLPPLETDAARRWDVSRVGPGEVRLDLLQEHVEAFLAGAPAVTKPRWQGEAGVDEVVDVDVDVLVVEGTYALQLEVPGALALLLTATWQETLEGRLARARDPIDGFIDEVLRREQPMVRAQAGRADALLEVDGSVRWVR
jgi:pantothenate kinase-related protein Tda10